MAPAAPSGLDLPPRASSARHADTKAMVVTTVGGYYHRSMSEFFPESAGPGDGPRLVTLARAWHALSHHAEDGSAFGGASCNCLAIGPRLAQVLDWFDLKTVDEPRGLGAVVTNVFTDGVWVRATHPDLPWRGGTNPAPQSWCDPASEDWFTWEELPRPVQVRSAGWTPSAHVDQEAESDE